MNPELDQAFSACHGLWKAYPLLTAALGLFVVQRMSVYRFVRPYSDLLIVAILVYRLTTISEEDRDLLKLLLQEINSIISLNPGLQKALFVVKDILGVLLVFRIVYAIQSLLTIISRYDGFDALIKSIAQVGYGYVKNLSLVKQILQKEEHKLEQSLEAELKLKSRALGDINTELPAKGWSNKEILAIMKQAVKEEDVVWEEGNVSGAVYHGKRDHIKLLNEAYSYYSISNPLHPDIWPSVMKFEAEIIAMTAALVKGGSEKVCGCTTSGGTESIILAIKAHRDYYCEKYQIKEPELICAVSAHAAVDKACDMMRIKLIKVDLDHDYRINLSSVRAAITSNTIMMYASAPSYPHGAIDPVQEMGQIAKQFGIGLHVDCCLGGFVLPFAKAIGMNIPEFDFSVPGVSSMSLDTHKYGYALKGTSVVLYANKDLRHAQYFCYADWTGGMYTTPTIAGSRSGGLIAQCWASMMSMGQEHYRSYAKDIITTAQYIAKEVAKIEGILLYGKVDAMIVCFASQHPNLNIYNIGDEMHKFGWSLNALQHPPCLHLCVTVTHLHRAEKFIGDLKAAVIKVRENPNLKAGNAAIYGMTSALPPGPVNELLKTYNDVVLKL